MWLLVSSSLPYNVHMLASLNPLFCQKVLCQGLLLYHKPNHKNNFCEGLQPIPIYLQIMFSIAKDIVSSKSNKLPDCVGCPNEISVRI